MTQCNKTGTKLLRTATSAGHIVSSFAFGIREC
ncbi:uncharacterized protein METZ01_LOCUS311879, partial [marine metagenome]